MLDQLKQTETELLNKVRTMEGIKSMLDPSSEKFKKFEQAIKIEKKGLNQVSMMIITEEMEMMDVTASL